MALGSALVVWPLMVTALAGRLSFGDAALRDYVLAHRWLPLERVMLAVSWMASEYVTPIVLLVLLVLFWRRDRTAAVAAVGVAATSTVWQSALKALVARPRPEPILYPVWHGAGFPSGHVLTAVVLAFVLWWLGPRLGFSECVTRALGWAVWLWPLVVAFSRVYLNCHYLSDVVAGAALGAGHLGLAAALMALPARTWPRRVGNRGRGG